MIQSQACPIRFASFSSQKELKRVQKLCAIEKQVFERGFHRVAGVDEVGRGPLAGPVVASACVIPKGVLIPGINDSKKLSFAMRLALFEYIVSLSEIDYGIGIVAADVIDQVNILQATFQAMLIAIAQLKQKPDYLIVDGSYMPSIDLPGESVVKGDSKSQSIGAASILAKVIRDRGMEECDRKWPQYGFKMHKGYGTAAHLEAIKLHGPCPIHRMSFAPLSH